MLVNLKSLKRIQIKQKTVSPTFTGEIIKIEFNRKY